jgi:eukaryotic-like serine/threonine-protein kinase
MKDQTISHYRIVEKVGEGGMGVVYRAHDSRLNRDVALKFLPTALLNNENARALLIREARTASALNHPNICTIYDVGDQNGQNYIVMEFVKGRSLTEQIPEDGLPADTVIRYGEQIADAMAHAHEHGVIHRDLKSPNVIITAAGRVKVLDFGLAKHMTPGEISLQTKSISTLTSEGAIVGTMHYMAPELFRGESADARSDIWALGVILYEMVNGKRPFRGKTSYELSSVILHEDPPRLVESVPLGLRAVIEHCLAKDPQQRYQHASEVRAALEALRTNSAAIPASAIQPSFAKKSEVSWKPLTISLGVVAVIATVVTWSVIVRRKPPAQKTVLANIQSLAVLPLENISGDPNQDYFADGMSDAITTDLSQVKKLRVISRTSVMHYKGKQISPAQIAKELGVDALVEGSVLRSGDHVRISADLVQPQTGQNLWANSYDRQVTDILALQSDVARDIVTQIQIQLTPPEQERLGKSRAVVPAAYDAYLQARAAASKRTADALSRAVADFRRAIQFDPTYAPSYAGLAEALAILVDYSDVPSAKVLPEAEAAAEKALQLDPDLGSAHAALGLIRAFELQVSSSLSEFQRATELNPGDADAHQWYALALAGMGKGEQSVSEIKLAEELDPRSLIINANVAWCFYLAGEYDQAIAQAQKTISMDPSFAVAHGYLGQAYLEKGRYDEAFSELNKAIELSGNETSYQAELANAYAVAGRREDAERILQQLQERAAQHYVSPYSLALIYAGLGEKDQALRELELAYDQRANRLLNMKMQPRFSVLRSSPRFKSLVERIEP